jgi:hypothetical protein
MSTNYPHAAEIESDCKFDPLNPNGDGRIVGKALAMIIETIADDDNISIVEIIRSTIDRFKDHRGLTSEAAVEYLKDQLLDWT